MSPRNGPPPASRPPAPWLSISAYARAYGLTRNTVYKLLANASLETYRIRRRLVRIKNLRPDAHQP